MTMTIEQERARFALKRVKEHENAETAFRSRFRSYAKGLPAMIRMNGLGQALAFCRAKSTGQGKEAKAYKALYTIVSDWMIQDRQPLSGHKGLLEGITQVDMGPYRMAQVEAMALMEWVGKLAIAFLGDDKKGSSVESESPAMEGGATEDGGTPGAGTPEAGTPETDGHA